MYKNFMIKIYPYENLGSANHGWLDARHHFSFANYYNPERMNFGTLRVINDDIICIIKKKIVDFAKDRKLQADLGAELLDAQRRIHAFRHHIHGAKDLFDLFAFPKLASDKKVAAVLRKTGRDQIADTRQAKKSIRICAKLGTEPYHFIKPSRN